MPHPLVSILIPVYNVEAFIGDVFRQLADLCRMRPDTELIFVEDGSTDESLGILEGLMRDASLPNAKLIRHDRNRGLSEARNTGVDAAKGDYIWFLDSDDFISVEKAAELIDRLREAPADCVLFDFFKFEERPSPKISVGQYGPEAAEPDQFHVVKYVDRSLPPLETITAREEFLVPYLIDGQHFSWAMIVRRRLLDGKRFPAGMLFEDHAVSPCLVLDASSARYHPVPIVLYRLREGSIMTERSLKSAHDVGQAMFLSLPAFEDEKAMLTDAERAAFGTCLLRSMRWQLSQLAEIDLLSSPEGNKSLRSSVARFKRFIRGQKHEALRPMQLQAQAELRGLLFSPRLYLLYRRISHRWNRIKAGTGGALGAAAHHTRRFFYVVPPRVKPFLKKMLPGPLYRSVEQRWRRLLYKSG